MRSQAGLALLLTILAFGSGLGQPNTHPDYVPDAKTAERIAEAVLVSQYGEERVHSQSPLHATSMSKDEWLVEGKILDRSGRLQVGGGFGVVIDRHSGCLRVIEHMK